jgi:predicted phosphodiesterase
MKVAVFSDIHGNLEALRAVAADAGRRGEMKVICLGDIIGYGPDPEEVVNFVRRRRYDVVLGNHEFALADVRGRRWLNFQAAENNELSERLLSPDNLRYCTGLPKFLEYGRGYFVHGYPPDSVFRYLYNQSDEKILDLFEKNPEKIYFLGHTHRLELVVANGKKVERTPLQEGLTQLDADKHHIVNCGSVGQPRGRDRRAVYLIWDHQAGRLEVHHVDYDRERTIRKMRKLGLPEAYALRLKKK